MSKRLTSPTKSDVSRVVSGAMAAGVQIGEVRVLRDGSIVIIPAGMADPAILDDEIDAKLEEFAR
ncbi:hypothetical protein [Sphingomonas sp. CFBP9019]|uniref:hypothetical protein n=1 Tax=Sphingomonas sp. CFBP9019 TaxID=3096532 RepID=UPI002A6B394F|nr:hypothetical protein [Sphingomonas sp. CFBP9019]MDY1008962.1 hypothetical protein [Sphingomonas sp. CFBP9019]